MVGQHGALIGRQPCFQRFRLGAQQARAIVFAHGQRIQRLLVCDQPDPLDAIHFLALGQPQLPHIVQLLLARRLAVGIVDLQHDPFALVGIQATRLAVERPSLPDLELPCRGSVGAHDPDLDRVGQSLRSERDARVSKERACRLGRVLARPASFDWRQRVPWQIGDESAAARLRSSSVAVVHRAHERQCLR